MIKAIKEEFSEYEIDEVKSLKADIFIYSYEYGSCDGSGFAVWKRDGKWFYDSLGHCSCYGPTENIIRAKNMEFTWEQVSEIATEKNYNSYAVDVINYIKENKLND
jgi:hypothetical protein